jgi:hypothetical protein
VAYYRLYTLSAPEGRFVGFDEIEAADDAEALLSAERFLEDRALELWCGTRKVRTLLPVKEAASPAAPHKEPSSAPAGRHGADS